MIYLHMTTKLMVCHVADQDFDPTSGIYYLCMAVMISLVAAMQFNVVDQSLEELTLYSVGTVYLVYYVHQLYSVTYEITSILGIEVFRCKPKK